MGLLDDLGGLAKQAGGAALLNSALGKMNLQGTLAQLQAGGLGDQVKSWLGNGTNLPVTADQLRAALGNEKVQEIAKHLGLNTDDALKMLSEHLPTVVDQATPNGQLPPS